MKKAFRILIALILAIACTFSVACATTPADGEGGNVEQGGANNGTGNGGANDEVNNGGTTSGGGALDSIWGAGNLSADDDDFYYVVMEKLSSVEEFVYDFEMQNVKNSAIFNGEQTSHYTYTTKIQANGGMSIVENDLNVAVESKYEYIRQSETTTRTETTNSSIYIDNTKIYSKVNGIDENDKAAYYYDMEDFSDEIYADNSGEISSMLTIFLNDLQELGFNEMMNSALQENKSEIASLIKKYAEYIFTTTEADGGYEIKLDVNKVLAIIEDIQQLKVKEIIDKYVGEGTFGQIKASVNTLLDTKVNELIESLETQTDGKAMEFAKKILGKIIETEGMIDVTPEQMIENFVRDFGEKKIITIISEITALEEEKLLANIGGAFGVCENSTILYLLTEYTGVTESEFEEIKGYIQEYGNKITLALKVDKTGAPLQFVFIGKDFTDEAETLNFNVKIEFNKKFENFDEKVNEIIANLPTSVEGLPTKVKDVIYKLEQSGYIVMEIPSDSLVELESLGITSVISAGNTQDEQLSVVWFNTAEQALTYKDLLSEQGELPANYTITIEGNILYMGTEQAILDLTA